MRFKLKTQFRFILLALIILSMPIGNLMALTVTPARQFAGNGHWYQFVGHLDSWYAAKQWAENRGGYLATITSPAENAFLVSILDQVHSSANIGAYEPNNNGVWLWVTGEPWGYTHWISGEPSNTGGNEDYIQLTESGGWGWGGWNDGDSHNPSALIEYDSDPSQNGCTSFDFSYSLGNYWTVLHGDWAIENGQYSCYSSAASWASSRANMNLQNGAIEFDATPQPGSITPEMTIEFREQANGNRYEWINFGWNNTYSGILKYINGQATHLHYSLAESGVNGQTYHFRIELNGNSIKCYRDGALIYDVTDSDIPSGGTVTLHSYNSHVHFDNIVFNPDQNSSGCGGDDIEGPIILSVKSLGFIFQQDPNQFAIRVGFSDVGRGNSAVTHGEYFFDNNGSRYPFEISGGGVAGEKTLIVKSILENRNHLYVRVADELGNWSDAFDRPITSSQTGFNVKSHGYQFRNNRATITHPKDFLGLGGFCLGMAGTSIDKFSQDIPVPQDVTEFPDPSSSLYREIRDDHFDLTASNFLTMKGLQLNLFSHQSTYLAVRGHIAIDGPTIIGLWGYWPTSAGHAVVGFAFVDIGDSSFILAYDPNTPNYPMEIVVNLNSFDIDDITDPQFTRMAYITNTHPDMMVRAECPVDLEVVDPLGRMTSRPMQEIPGSEYFDFWTDGSADTARVISIDDTIPGRYVINIIPNATYPDDESYSLFVALGGIPDTLALNLPVGHIPLTYQFFTGPWASISGSVREGTDLDLVGVSIDIFDVHGTPWKTVVTDDTGYYHIDSIPNGDYTVKINTPLGYATDQETVAFTVNHVPVTVNFDLVRNASDKIRNIWWWKGQLQNIRDGKPSIVSKADINKFGEAIFKHYYQRGDEYAIKIENTTFMAGPRAINYDDLFQLFLGALENTDHARAGRALLANMLNVACGAQGQASIVSLDGATAAEAIIHFADRIQNGTLADHFNAYINLRRMHMGEKIPAGVIPMATPNVMFKNEEENTSIVPSEYALYQNYPNPFNPTTEISFALPKACDATLEVYNIAGQKVATLVDGTLEAGEHTVQWDSRDQSGAPVASGIYLYRLTAGEFTDSKKMILLK